jgi:hypothetical protein
MNVSIYQLFNVVIGYYGPGHLFLLYENINNISFIFGVSHFWHIPRRVFRQGLQHAGREKFNKN